MLAGVAPPPLRQARQVATPAASIAGCVLTVSSRRSAGPSCTSCQRSKPRSADASANVAGMSGYCSASAASIPTDCDPWPGKIMASVTALLHGKRSLYRRARRRTESQCAGGDYACDRTVEVCINDDRPAGGAFGTRQRPRELFPGYFCQHDDTKRERLAGRCANTADNARDQHRVQQPGEADVPGQARVEKPEAQVDNRERYERNKRPLPQGPGTADEQPDQRESGNVQQHVRETEMREVAGEEAPELTVRNAFSFVPQPALSFRAGERHQERDSRQKEWNHPSGTASQNGTIPDLGSLV